MTIVRNLQGEIDRTPIFLNLGKEKEIAFMFDGDFTKAMKIYNLQYRFDRSEYSSVLEIERKTYKE